MKYDLLDNLFGVTQTNKLIEKLEVIENKITPILYNCILYEDLLYFTYNSLRVVPFKVLQEYKLYNKDTMKINTNPLLYYSPFQIEYYYNTIINNLTNLIIEIDSIDGEWNNKSRSIRKNTINNIQKILEHIERINVLMKLKSN